MMFLKAGVPHVRAPVRNVVTKCRRGILDSVWIRSSADARWIRVGTAQVSNSAILAGGAGRERGTERPMLAEGANGG
jgi:hypothetical protein